MDGKSILYNVFRSRVLAVILSLLSDSVKNKNDIAYVVSLTFINPI